MKSKCDEGTEARKRFEEVMSVLFKAPKPPKHKPKKRRKKGTRTRPEGGPQISMTPYSRSAEVRPDADPCYPQR